MSKKKTNIQTPTLQDVIDQVLIELEPMRVDSEEFAKTAENLDKLYKMQTYKNARRISPEAYVAVGGNLAGILAILWFEKAGVVTSKALGFVMKSVL